MIAPMKINLTDAQKEALELMHDTTRDGRIRDRIKAVLLASEELTTRLTDNFQILKPASSS